MPPSPSLRCSPGREHRMENTHKRGHSFESGLTLRAKDDDLTLFNDMQNRERESFLLHTADDFDDSLSKLRYLSDFKLGITIPARGKSSDLLNVDGEKNDYDWLLTPPDTPLFPSLDDEEPQPQNMPPRGRPRSQPINISRPSSVNEKTHRSSRGSASPRHLSPSPRSSNNFGQLILRPSSAPRSSPPLLARPVTPSRRPSTPPNKPSTLTPRSSTPTLRRMSTGSSGQASSSGRRGASPMRANRGNSASPKLRGWQSNLPGFSSDAPPNLRTSLSDRPLPHVRGSSPTPSRSGRGRQSMSPTASRSASSSHSNDRDLLSSYSKGSVVSSGDDDMDSLHSVAISSSPPSRRNGMLVNSRPMALSKKPSRTSPSNSLPKRSFESVLRQMDNRKTPQNMFRPLLSSVPSTTFNVGKANSTHRPMFSRNSSLTTSISASSDQGASVAPDMEGSKHKQNDLTEGWERTQEHDAQDEVFIFDKADDIIEDNGQELDAENPLSGTGTSDAVMSNKVSATDSEDSMANFGGAACTAAAAEFAHATGDLSVVDGCEIMAICSKCGKHFRLLGVDGKTDLCQECEEIDGLFAAGELLLPPTITQTPTMKSEVTSGMDASVDEVPLNIGVPELPERSSGEIILGQHENNIEEGLNSLDNSCPVQLVMDQSESQLPDQQLDSQKDASSIQCDSENKFVQTAHPSRKIDNHEGTGISVLLLQQSSSSKWPVVQSRAFSATNILCAEPSYVRDNNSAMRRSIGRDSASASSSMDMGSSRQIDARIQRQICNRKVEMDSVRSDTDAKSQCSGSYSDLTINAYELFPPKNDTEVAFNSSTEGAVNEVLQESVLGTRELDSSLGHTDMNSANFSTCKKDFVDSDAHINDDFFIVKNTSNSQLLSYSERHHYETSAADNLKDEDCPLCMNANEDPWRENEKSSLDIEVPNRASDSSIIAEQRGLNDPSCQSDISDVATNSSTVILESQNDHDSSQNLQTECGPVEIPSNEEAIHEHSVSPTLEQDMLVSNLEADLDDHAHGIREESTVIVEGPRGHTSRSLTLAEATDTILFCSSIIHDIAYKAATIGMEELVLPPEATRPTVTIPYKSVEDHNNSRKVANKHTPKSHKFKRKLEAQTKSPLTESGSNVIVQGSTHPASMENIPKKAPDSTKPLKLESKCNCTVM